MNFNESPEFKKDIKALSKKVRTLKSDLDLAYALIEQLYVAESDEELKKYRSQFFGGKVATIVHKSDTHEAIKMRLDTNTRPMAGKLRLVFVAVISSGSVTFIEIYSKNVKSREDRQRLQRYLG